MFRENDGSANGLDRGWSGLDLIKRLINDLAMSESQQPTGTRTNLIAAGLRLFGRSGFDGTSTRSLAEHAGTNVASIAYHFGGKEGLRQACAQHVAQRLGEAFTAAEAGPAPADPQTAMRELERTVHDFAIMLLVSPEASDFVPFVLRELTDPGVIADMIFSHFFLPRHARLCRLWSVVTGKPAEADEVKLAVFAAIGQVLYFRMARPFVTRRMGWEKIGQPEAELIVKTVVDNLRAITERTRK